MSQVAAPRPAVTKEEEADRTATNTAAFTGIIQRCLLANTTANVLGGAAHSGQQSRALLLPQQKLWREHLLPLPLLILRNLSHWDAAVTRL
eukprot:scaffold126487_cov14-Tisochrysis_lutea.AAC.1